MTPALRFTGVRAPVHGDEIGGPWSFTVETGRFMAMEAAPSLADAVMELCVGNDAPLSGEVEVLGERPGALHRRERHALLRRMGVAFQREGLVDNLALEENLIVPLVFASGYRRADARAAARQAMDALGLSAFASRRPAALSREARTLAALARAALRHPELLLVEHLTGRLPERLAERALRWCRARSHTMLVLVPGPSAALDRLADGWLPPLIGTREEGSAT